MKRQPEARFLRLGVGASPPSPSTSVQLFRIRLCKAGSMYTEIEKSHQLYLSYYGKDIYNGFLKQTLMPWYCFKIEKM